MGIAMAGKAGEITSNETIHKRVIAELLDFLVTCDQSRRKYLPGLFNKKWPLDLRKLKCLDMEDNF
jgi:hypothetical protein